MGATFTMITACGPFTMDLAGTLNVFPFLKLLDFVAEHRPNVLLLLGPFINGESKAVGKGTLDRLPEEILHAEFMTRLNRLLADLPNLQIIIVPSTKDIMADSIYPQPSYSIAEQPRVILAPNPALISIDGSIVYTSSSELFLPLGMAEYFKSSKDWDRHHRLCSYIHQQASFYPLHPAPSGVNIDYNLLHDLEFSEYPDLYICPSQLGCFARSIEPTIYINSGQLCRSASLGTTALVTVIDGDARVDFYQL